MGSCVIFLARGTILQQWKIVPVTVEEICQRLLNNRASNCWKIMLVTVRESCQPLLNKRASNCWRIVLATVEQSCQRLLHIILSCWTIVPVTVEELYQQLLKNYLCQWLLKNYDSDCCKNCASDCRWIVSTTVKQSRQLFFSFFNLL